MFVDGILCSITIADKRCNFVYMFTVILFILILSLLVLVHEWGHFYAARKSGMKVYEFGIGFPPRAFGVYKDPKTKKWKFVSGKGKGSLQETVGGDKREEEFPATLYSFNWLPLGGFVKIKGENGEAGRDKDSFGYHKTWKKVVVLVAGVTMNFILAAVLLAVGFMIGLPTDVSDGVPKGATLVDEPAVMIQQVVDDSPAKEAGLTLGDKITAINGTTIVSSAQMIEAIQQSQGEVQLLLIRAEEPIVLTLTPKSNNGTAQIGALLAEAAVVKFPWYIAIWKGITGAWFGLINIFIGFFFLIKGLVLGQGLAFDVAGPVGIANIIGQSAKLGIHYLINITAMISLSLAAINILPIPALDGGRLLFVLIEKATGKPVPMKYEQVAHTIGFLALMLLIVVVTVRDVAGIL